MQLNNCNCNCRVPAGLRVAAKRPCMQRWISFYYCQHFWEENRTSLRAKIWTNDVNSDQRFCHQHAIRLVQPYENLLLRSLVLITLVLGAPEQLFTVYQRKVSLMCSDFRSFCFYVMHFKFKFSHKLVCVCSSVLSIFRMNFSEMSSSWWTWHSTAFVIRYIDSNNKYIFLI